MLRRARDLYDNGDCDEAIAAYTEVIRLWPEISEACCYRGKLHGAKGEYGRAIADFTEAIRLGATCGAAYYGRARAHDRTHDFENAIVDYTETLRLEPKYAFL